MNVYKCVMEALEYEWKSFPRKHLVHRDKEEGIRSSQISALVAYLIDCRIITEENCVCLKEER
jgi:hypothetical protein